jgi:putative FmdB family regulatory protein
VPTYDYQCRSCGHTIEVIHSMREEGPSTCERCGGQLRRVFFPTGIIFKGSGFYKTDSRSSGSESGSSSTGSSSADKPAASADGKVPPSGGNESGAATSAPTATDSSKKD